MSDVETPASVEELRVAAPRPEDVVDRWAAPIVRGLRTDSMITTWFLFICFAVVGIVTGIAAGSITYGLTCFLFFVPLPAWGLHRLMVRRMRRVKNFVRDAHAYPVTSVVKASKYPNFPGWLVVAFIEDGREAYAQIVVSSFEYDVSPDALVLAKPGKQMIGVVRDGKRLQLGTRWYRWKLLSPRANPKAGPVARLLGRRAPRDKQ